MFVSHNRTLLLQDVGEPIGLITGLYPNVPGVWIMDVHPGGAAHRAGVKPDKRLLSVNGEEVTTQEALRNIVGTAKALGRLDYEVELDATTYEEARAEAELSAAHAAVDEPRVTRRQKTNAPAVFAVERRAGGGGQKSMSIGLQFFEVYDPEAQTRWLEVTGCADDSPASAAGVPRGELRAVNGEAVETKEDVARVLAREGGGNSNEKIVLLEVAPYDILCRTRVVESPPDSDEDLGVVFRADEHGVRTAQVAPGSYAARAGIKPNRRVLQLDGQKPAVCMEPCETGRLFMEQVEAARLKPFFKILLEATPEEAESAGDHAGLVHDMQRLKAVDADGFVWVSVAGEAQMITLPPRNLARPSGEPMPVLPEVGDDVMIVGLTGAEAAYNGTVGTAELPPPPDQLPQYDGTAPPAPVVSRPRYESRATRTPFPETRSPPPPPPQQARQGPVVGGAGGGFGGGVLAGLQVDPGGPPPISVRNLSTQRAFRSMLSVRGAAAAAPRAGESPAAATSRKAERPVRRNWVNWINAGNKGTPGSPVRASRGGAVTGAAVAHVAPPSRTWTTAPLSPRQATTPHASGGGWRVV